MFLPVLVETPQRGKQQLIAASLLTGSVSESPPRPPTMHGLLFFRSPCTTSCGAYDPQSLPERLKPQVRDLHCRFLTPLTF